MADSLNDLAKAAKSATEVGELETMLEEKQTGSTLRALIDSQEGRALKKELLGYELISKQQILFEVPKSELHSKK